jgi:predicted lipase
MNSIVNWLNDLSVGFTPIIPGNSAQVHPGFLNIYQSHKNFLFPAVTNLIAKYPDYDVIATGHSMGGSSATLFSFDMFKNYGISKTKLVTFGSPRVGNADFRKQFISSGISSWRFTNMNDIVPHLPLSMQGFQHVSNEIFQTTSNGVVSYKICNDANGEDPSCANKQILLGIQDHTHYMGVFSGMCANIAQK